MTRTAALRGVRERVRSWPGGTVLWRVLVTLAGVATIVIGIVLLPLPGPGWVIIFAGLGILATEYEWARALLRRARRYVLAWRDWFAAQPRWVHVLVGLLGLVLLVVIAASAWWLF